MNNVEVQSAKLQIEMNKCQNEVKTNKCINLYRKDLQSKQVQKKNNLILNLDRWRFLSKGGAYWIFHLQKQQQKQNFNSMNQYERNGNFVFRLKQFKWLNKIIDIRSQIIAHSLQKSQLNNQKENTEKDLKINQQTDNEIQKLLIELENEDKKLLNQVIKISDPLSNLLKKIYDQFINQCLNLTQKNEKKDDCQLKKQNSIFLPQISKAIVRQSEPYYIINQNNQSTKDKQNLENSLISDKIDILILFLLRQLIIHKLTSKIPQNRRQTLKNEVLQQLTTKNFKNYPINFQAIRHLVVNQQYFVTFQPNLLHFSFEEMQNKETVQKQRSNSHQKDKINLEQRKLFQICINQVFQFKPKTVIPDIYSGQFIDNFVKRHKNFELTRKSTLQRQQQRNDDKNEEEKLNDNLLKSQSLTEDYFRSKIIKNLQQTIDQNDPSRLLISSTRWFKKNCLQKDNKNKNQNPIKYFYMSLSNNKHIQKENIEYYSKKHLRKMQLIYVIQKEKYPKFQNDSEKKIFLEQQQVKINRNSQSLHEKIIEFIWTEQTRHKQIRIRAHQSLQQITQQSKKLSLIDEILALQLIDVIDAITQKDVISGKQTNSSQSHSYVDVLQLQNISHSLTSLISTKSIDQYKNIHKDLPLNQSYFPSKSFLCIKKAFYPLTYLHALKLSQTLKQIIFRSLQIDQLILQTFFAQQSSILFSNTQNFFSSHKHDIKIKIKNYLFYLVRYLISLTWKDISILVQQNVFATIQQKNYHLLGLKSEKQIQFKPQINQIKVEKQVIKSIKQQSVQFKRIIKNCSIIDYNLKTLQNIDKNVQKDSEFLYNFSKHQIDEKV